MSGHNFKMRLNSTYTDSENSVGNLTIELWLDGQWQDFDVENTTAGFLVFVYSVFSCQHMHFRLGAVAHDLVLASSEGHITINTDKQWNINLLHVNFEGTLLSGDATDKTIDAICKRMGLCPVSRNLKPITDNKTVVTFG